MQATLKVDHSHQRGSLQRDGVGEAESGERWKHGRGKNEGEGGAAERLAHHEDGCGRGQGWLSTSVVGMDSFAYMHVCMHDFKGWYTEKAPNSWHRRENPKDRKHPQSTQTTVDRHN